MSKDPMREPYVTISWCPLDVYEEFKDEYDLTEDEAKEVLSAMSKQIEEMSIAYGYEIMANIIDNYIVSEETNG
jgi:hypothetical protein